MKWVRKKQVPHPEHLWNFSFSVSVGLMQNVRNSLENHNPFDPKISMLRRKKEDPYGAYFDLLNSPCSHNFSESYFQKAFSREKSFFLSKRKKG